MRVRAVTSFSGAVCGYPGQELDIPDHSPVLADLLQAGHVEPVAAAELSGTAKKTVSKSSKKKGE